jgi:hypothetical protein
MNKNYLKPLLILVLGLLCTDIAQAQESSNSTGGDATGSGGKVSYSVGQTTYTTNSDSTGSVAQGVQHSYFISNVGTEVIPLISITLFPNPTTDVLTLQISEYKNEKLSYELYDLKGKLLIKGQIEAQQTQIDTKSLPTSTYFLNIIHTDTQKVQSFKIIKT